MHTMHVPSACTGQKRVLNVLKLESQVVVSSHTGAENQVWVLCKTVSALNH